MRVASVSIRRPVTTIMFFVSLFVISLIAAVRLPLEAFPEVSPPFIFVSLPYTGSTPEEIERTVLRPAEEELSTMSGIKRMDSRAREDGAQLFIQLSDWSKDVEIAESNARESIDAIRAELTGALKSEFGMRCSTTVKTVDGLRIVWGQSGGGRVT